MAIETTLVLVKPDGVRRGLIGEVIGRFEAKGYEIVGAKMLKFTDDIAARHYAEHVEKPFFPELKEFIMSGPVVALAVRGESAISLVRKMMGKTKPEDAEMGSIRGDFATSTQCNIVHGSDSPESAARELPIYFSDEELF